MSKYFSEEEGQTCRWSTCIFCRRKWMEASLELELCPLCLEAIRKNPGNYDEVKIDMFVKNGEFQDRNLSEAVKMIWDYLRK